MQNLAPLYWAGLCDAVNMAPGASRVPEAKYMRSVEPRPRSTTSRPWDRTPSANASTNDTPDGRMSRATRMRRTGPDGAGRSAPSSSANRAKPAPMARAARSSICSG